MGRQRGGVAGIHHWHDPGRNRGKRPNSDSAAKNLDPGESVLLSVSMSYALKMTTQSAQSYPRNYGDSSMVVGYTEPTYKGIAAFDKNSSYLIAYAKVVGRQ